MKQIQESRNKHRWPRKATKAVECRKRDLVIRVTNWWDDRDEPAYDVEVYIGGVYDFNESKSFTKSPGLTADGVKVPGLTQAEAKAAATKFAADQIAKLL
jgi:hypothetical protein